jgi:type VI secretion system secreted protein Hcp
MATAAFAPHGHSVPGSQTPCDLYDSSNRTFIVSFSRTVFASVNSWQPQALRPGISLVIQQVPLVPCAMGAILYFLKIDGIEGESYDARHRNEIDVLSWSWGETHAVNYASTGVPTVKVSVNDLHFVMKTNKATPKLMQACASGQSLGNAVLSTVRSSSKEQQEYFRILLSDVRVSSYNTGGSSGDGTNFQTDQASLSFSKIELEYKEQQPNGMLGGVIRGVWDRKLSKGS